MALADDILARIRQDFFGGETLSVIDRFESLQRENGQLFTDRILRCILFVAAGQPAVVEQAVEQARKDPRDLIIWAEYDGHFGTRHRDLSLPLES